MDMKRVYLAFCAAMVFTLVFTMGCDSSMEGYRTFTFNKVAHFSFEYPVSYQKPSVDRTAEPYITLVDTLHILQEGEIYSLLSAIGIAIYNSTYYSTDASTMLEEYLREWEDSESGFIYSDFQLLERSQVTVSGIQGEQIVYSYNEIRVVGQRRIDEDSYHMQGRSIYFYSGGLIWELTLHSLLSEAETANADFEHLLETFQILD